MAPLPGGQLLSGGCNSFPRGINDYVEARQVRPEKYKWFVHAEANAVYNAARSGISLDKGILYCQWLPCPTCAMAIIQSGISCIVVASFNVPERWRGDMNVAVTMLGEADVDIRLVDGDIQDYGFVLKVLNGKFGVKDFIHQLIDRSDLEECPDCLEMPHAGDCDPADLMGCAECDVPAGVACLESCTSGN
jgi:dCMP deaminase